MQETETKEKEKEKEKETSLVLVGHYHHQATCACSTVTTVETYYKQLPPIICPSCQKENITKFTREEGLFVSKETKECLECGCRYTVNPAPKNPTCPTCKKPAIEVTDGNETPPELQEGQA